MPKPTTVQVRKKNTVRIATRNKAISLLSEWAHSRMPVEFIDPTSGLRYPGLLADLSSGDLEAFHFLGHSGIIASILPLTWTKVTIEEVTGLEVIQAESKIGRYGIGPDHTRQSNEDDVDRVRDQFANWHAQRTQVYVAVTHAFYALAFMGKIVIVNDVGCLIKPERDGDLLAISLDAVICSVETEPAVSVALVHVPTGTRLHISENELRPASLFVRSPMPSRVVH